VTSQESGSNSQTPQAELATKYDPHAIEEKWYSAWEASGAFQADPKSAKPPFSIVIPPPNVTGSLHIGHALNNTVQDILCRKARMEGKDVLWVPGCDHAGIATQNVVERQLAKEKKSRHDLGREKFIERVWEWKEQYGGTIMRQLRRLGSSLDWSRERFTMDAGLSDAVKEVFVRLYHEGLIYRGDYIINWCPRCQTALSDIETEHQDVNGHFWHFRYPLSDGSGELVVATTRPETMLGDTAVAVNPEDERYQKLVGKTVRLPLMNRDIPVVADTYVDREFGTGVVKITPAHDPNDFWVAERHHLPRINVMNPDGTMSKEAGPYAGLDRFEARKRLVEDLEAQGYLAKIEDHLHAVGHCYRCHTIVEPYLSRQWFVKMEPLAKPAIAAVKEGKIRFTPAHWADHYLQWMENIRDWCISRQIWWGHRIPAWYCQDCQEVIVTKDEPKTCPKCGGGKLVQDPDVLDTWFSSALWPFSTLGWPLDTPELKKYYPTSVLVTSWDIIFFWVARMIMMGLHFRGEIPFHEVCINSLVGDAEGKKMSKSKGNTVDPLDIMQHTGADGLRFTMAMIETQSRYVAFTPDRLESSRNFANKIWNAARFSLMNLEGFTPGGTKPEADFIDQWIQGRLSDAIFNVTRAIDGDPGKGLSGYRFAEAAQVLYRFIWNEFCDWYVELCKPRLYGSDPAKKYAAQYYLYQTLETLLRLLHPFMPFITEELWSQMPGKQGFVMHAAWPTADPLDRAAQGIEQEMAFMQGVIYQVRLIRGEKNIAPGQKISLLIHPLKGQEGLARIAEKHAWMIRELGRVGDLKIGGALTKPPRAAAAFVTGLDLWIPLEGIIDFVREKERLEKRIQQMAGLILKIQAKLANPGFLAKAPSEVVKEEETKMADYQMIMDQERKNLADLE
jgi:valyl-tRNA synthetase